MQEGQEQGDRGWLAKDNANMTTAVTTSEQLHIGGNRGSAASGA